MPLVDFRAVKEIVSMRDTVRALAYRYVARTPDRLRGPCPFHSSTSEGSRSLQINLAIGQYYCFKCHAQGDQIDLFRRVMGCSAYEAAQHLCSFAGVPVPYLPKR